MSKTYLSVSQRVPAKVQREARMSERVKRT